MTAAIPGTDLIETFHGTSDGAFGVTLVGGHIEVLTLPMSAMDPTAALELGTTLVNLLNEALDKHTADLLEAASPARTADDPEVEAVERFVAQALAKAEATIAAAPSLQRDYEAAVAHPASLEVVGQSPDGEVEAALVLGRLRRLRISERLLATARPADAAAAVILAVHNALGRNAIDWEHLVEGLPPEQLAHETSELCHRIDELESEPA